MIIPKGQLVNESLVIDYTL